MGGWKLISAWSHLPHVSVAACLFFFFPMWGPRSILSNEETRGRGKTTTIIRMISLIENFRFSVFKFFENKENSFSYENKTKTNFKNKENEFTTFNILYINQKTIMCYFPYFRIKSKIRDLMDYDKMKTPNYSFLLVIPFSSSTSIFFSSDSRKHGIMNSNLYFKHIFIVFINFIFKKIVLQNGFFYSLFSTKFKYETYFLKMKTKDYNTFKIFIF